jgi:two-component system, cell cycle response regulator
MSARILVVDDEAANRDLLEAILVPEGYQVEQASDGLQALARAKADPPDLILLDLLMPGLTGREVCRELKQHPGTQALPIIIVTAVGTMPTKEELLTCGADEYLTKPIERTDLQMRVRALLRVKQSQEPLARSLGYQHGLESARLSPGRTGGAQPEPAETLSAPEDPIAVLVVDDDVLIRTVLADLLGKHDCVVLAAGSGDEGLALAERHLVDVALVDLVMPGMSGLEVLETLRARDPDLPVIILTAYAAKAQYSIAALRMGAVTILGKHIDPEGLVITVLQAAYVRRERLRLQEENQRLQAQVVALGGARR